MKHFGFAASIVSLAPLAAFVGVGHAQTLPTVPIWGAGVARAARVGAWGNGSAEGGGNGSALQVTVRNFQEGMRFDLAKPLDLAPYRQAGFWRIRVQLSGASQGFGGRGGRDRGQRGGSAATPAEAPLTQLRIKLMLDSGAMTGILPLGQASRGGDGWQTLLLPVRSLSSTAGASGLVRRIVLTGDSVGTFSLDQVSLVAETDSITAAVRRSSDPEGTDLKDVTLKPGRGAALVADVNGGTSDIIVLWNFDADNSGFYPAPAVRGGGGGEDRGRGGRPGASSMTGAPGGAGAGVGAGAAQQRPRVDAVGLSAQPNWPNEEQDYRVEVTILDRSGKKPPVRKSINVAVRG